MAKRPGPPQLSLFGARDAPPPAVAAAAELATALPSGLRMGTSSWSFPGWRELVWGRELSEAALAREGLSLYARHPLFRTVGIDRTYYAPVDAEVLAGYAAQVPADFRFLVKAHDHCTLPRFPDHARYGGRRGAENDRYLDPAYAAERVVAPYVEGLGEKGGVLLFQLSPGPAPARFPERLHAFLTALPKGPRYAVELRSARLLTPAYLEALADAGAIHCFNVHVGMTPLAEQVDLADPLRMPALVVRWMLHAGLGYERAKARYEPFDRLVDPDPDTRLAIASLLERALAAGKQALLIVNNKAEGSSPASIVELARLLAARRKAEAPTP